MKPWLISWIVLGQCLLTTSGLFQESNKPKCDSVWGESPMVPRQGRFRTLGWDDADVGSWPWVGSLEYHGPGGFNHTCSVTLINRSWVVTSANCFPYGKSHRLYKVYFGIVDKVKKASGQIQFRYLDKLYVSPFKMLALAKLSNPVRVNSAVKPIPMSKENMDILRASSDFCYVVGWGSGYSDILQQFKSSLLVRGDCGKDEGRYSRNKKFCDAKILPKPTGCQGSYGSPIMCRTLDKKYFPIKKNKNTCANRQYIRADLTKICAKFEEDCLKGVCRQVWRLVGVVPNGIHCGRKRGTMVSINQNIRWIRLILKQEREGNGV